MYICVYRYIYMHIGIRYIRVSIFYNYVYIATPKEISRSM